MRKFLLILISGVILMSCNKKNENPFFSDYNTPLNTPPFEKIKDEHYLPAFKEGMKKHSEEIKAIAENKEEPTFENSIDALENSGKLLIKVNRVFMNVSEANTNETLRKISKEVAPLLSKHYDEIYLNQKLFERVKKLYDKKDSLNLTDEQKMVLKKYYTEFVRGGANLKGADKETFKKINEELAILQIKFGENVLNDHNAFEMVLDKKEDLEGLPESVIESAANEAKARGYEGKWVFTIDKPSMIPFLQYSKKRNLREKIFYAYTHKGDNNNENDNKEIIKKIIKLRTQKANLLGYNTFADYQLDDNMAKTPDKAVGLLSKLWKAAVNKAKSEVKEMQKIIDKEGGNFKLKPWDWWYYAEKVKKAKYAFDESQLKPYFKLENVRDGAFKVANLLFDITFTERKDIQVYHPDVKVFEVKDENGKHIGLLYTDYFVRPSKRGGAWMEAYRKQYKGSTPVICNVCNFSKPAGDQPALLSFDDVNTLFHEFGHALHGLLSNCNYRKVSGTSVARDFVELFSQIMENWASEPEVMKMYAKHYKTGEPIPDELIKKIQKASHFNQGFATTEFLAAGLLDMKWHTTTDVDNIDVSKFENDYLKSIGLIPEIVSRYRSTYFNHIFSGDDYAAGYYSYAWAEVLDADAFEAFKEKGIFNKELAKSFRENLLSRGGTEDPMKLYLKFRGKEPSVEPLIKRRGLN